MTTIITTMQATITPMILTIMPITITITLQLPF